MKKKPQRSCVSCRTVRDKNDLLRVVVTPEGDVVYDPTGKLAGRGAYLCRNEACITAELKKAAKLSKGLKKPLTEEEIKALFDGEEIEIDYLDKKGVQRTAKGKLGKSDFNGTEYWGFAPDFQLKKS